MKHVELQLQNEELQRITAELAASKDKYRDLYEFAPIGYLTVEPSGQIREANLAAAALLGTERTHLLDNLFQAYLAEDSLSKFNDFCSRVKASDAKEIAEIHLFGNGTKERDNDWALIEARAISGSSNHSFRMAIIDITERKQAEQRLRQSEERYRIVFESAPEVIFTITSTDRTTTSLNPAFEKITGWSTAEWLGKSFLGIVHPEDLPVAQEMFNETLKGGYALPHELRILSKSGKYLTAEIMGVPQMESGKIAGKLGFARNITDRKLAEERLEKSEQYYRLLAENVTDVIWTMDMDLKFTYLSPSITGLIGYSVEEATLLTLEKILTPPSLMMVKQVFAEELDKEKDPQKDLSRSRTLEVEEYCKDGRTIWAEVKTSFLRDKEGQAVGMQGISRDITDRKKAERALIESEAKYRTIFENTGNAAVILEEDTTIALANAEAEKIFGYIATEVVGKRSWTEFIFKDDLELMKKYHVLRRSDPLAVPRNYEFRLIDGLGKIRHIFMTIAMIPGTKQSIASLMDITERKIAEDKLKASLAEKEMLLKEIHHRVKNNLQVVSSLLSLQSGCVKDKQTFDMLQESQNRIKSMAMIHEKLYRSDDIAKINFSEYIRSLSSNLMRSYDAVFEGVRLDLNVEDIDLGLDAAIPCGLIINELVSNSLKHAFPKSSNIRRGEIKIEFLREDNNKFKLSVSDNGIGFPQNLDFQQTESLGLQLVRILTDQLCGSIDFHSNFGTTFIITFTENGTGGCVGD
ncbi:MAG: PAS domain S-box protein [Methanotrichaceae archaeon]|nr:PAS domain S-box protein [Methanotrichaceae archaeon]